VCGDEELAWRSVTWYNGMQVGATMQEEFRVLPCRVKIQSLAFMVVPGNGLAEDIVL
jgi:hypothetical protein